MTLSFTVFSPIGASSYAEKPTLGQTALSYYNCLIEVAWNRSDFEFLLVYHKDFIKISSKLERFLCKRPV